MRYEGSRNGVGIFERTLKHEQPWRCDLTQNMMRHVEYVMNHIQGWDLINLDGGTSKVTTFERYFGQSPEYTIAPFGS